MVNVHERCGTEIEYLKSKQWFIKYLDLKDEMLEWGRQLNWKPEYMRHRYEHWVNGLQWDWLISRQRYFGVPFPVWYCAKCDEIVLAREEDLPVDPLVDKPPLSACPKCGHGAFVPERDILDTWATSSLTPHLSCDQFKGRPIYERIYPMSLRPQAHDIITFWLFNTVVKSRLHDGANPWKDVVISGHAQDPQGRKMSKSKGNVIEPQVMIDKYCADSLRFWAAGCKLGEDLPFSEKDLVTGQKFITKIWNASKFMFMHLEDYDGGPAELEDADKWLLTRLSAVVRESTEAFDQYEYSRTKAEVEKFFWQTFCDFYLEIVKERLYKPDLRGAESRRAAQYTLYHALLAIVKMMAPIMPHISEEIYQTFYAKTEKAKSVHNATWPQEFKAHMDERAARKGDLLAECLSAVRKAKTDMKISVAKEVETARITGKKEDLELIRSLETDLRGTGKVKGFEYAEGDALKVELTQ
jgi:valyl-tRNA synthetase